MEYATGHEVVNARARSAKLHSPHASLNSVAACVFASGAMHCALYVQARCNSFEPFIHASAQHGRQHFSSIEHGFIQRAALGKHIGQVHELHEKQPLCLWLNQSRKRIFLISPHLSLTTFWRAMADTKPIPISFPPCTGRWLISKRHSYAVVLTIAPG